MFENYLVVCGNATCPPDTHSLELVTRTFNALIILESLWPLSLHIFLLFYSFSLFLLDSNYMFFRHFHILSQIPFAQLCLSISLLLFLFGYFLLICLHIHWFFPMLCNEFFISNFVYFISSISVWFFFVFMSLLKFPIYSHILSIFSITSFTIFVIAISVFLFDISNIWAIFRSPSIDKFLCGPWITFHAFSYDLLSLVIC